MLGGHGDETFNLGKKLRANFSSNVWDTPMPETFYSHLMESLADIGGYPAPCAENLATKIAEFHKVGADSVLMCNGATEAFYLLAHAFAGKKTLLPVPSFSEYYDACLLHSHRISTIDISKFSFDMCGAYNTVWLCNPNNPDGKLYSSAEILRFADEFPNTLFIVDEAYLSFSDGTESVVSDCVSVNNIVVVKSMTKQFHMPGLRLGYLVANADLVGKIKRFKMPWSVNAVAIAAGEYIVDNGFVHPQFDLSAALKRSAFLQNEIDAIDGFSVLKNQGCFFLVKTEKGTAAALKAFLLDRYSLLIRDAGNFKGLSPKHFRISAQTEERNKQLVCALKEWVLTAD